MAEKARIVLTAEDQTRQAFSSVRRNLDELNQAVSQIRNVGGALLGAEIAQSLGEGARAIVAARVEFEKLQNTLGQAVGVGRVGQELAFIRQTAQQLGLEFNATANSYAKFAAASRGTALEGQQTREVFIGIAQASTALGLSSEETAGALTAIQQIISKGKVSAEELRGQLGERLPGAFQIAARAAGVTTQELDALLQSGSLLADDFLPKFGRQLQVEFADAAKRAADSTQASLNRLQTSFNNLKRELSQGFVGDAIKSGIDQTATSIDGVAKSLKRAEDNSKTFLGTLLEIAQAIRGPAGAALRALGQRSLDAGSGGPGGALQAPGSPSFREQVAAGEAIDNDAGQLARLSRRSGALRADRESLRTLQQQFRTPQQVQADQIAELRRLGALTGDDVSGQIAEIQRRNTRAGPGVDRAAQDATAYVKALNEQITALQKVSEVEKVIAELRDGKLRGATAAQFDEALQIAGQVDARRALSDEAERALELARRQDDFEREQESAAEARYKRLQDEIQAFKDLADPARKYREELQRINELEKAGAFDTPEQAALARTAIEERIAELSTLKRQTTELEDTARSLGLTFSSSLEEAVVNFKGLRSLAQGLTQDLLRFSARKLITEPLVNGLGRLFGGSSPGATAFDIFSRLPFVPFAEGGVMTSAGPLPLRKYAGGGIARSAQVAIFGEGDRPEAFVPLPDGRSIPVTMQGGGATIVQNFDMRNSTTSENLVRTAAALGAAQARASLFDDRARGREAFA